jgi:eukaryotic-like serine/threonine-protein kinase
MAIAEGSRLGPYEVIALLGQGGMGMVWRARHSALKRDDALKVLPPAFVANPDRLARFQREAQILASLNHPNIARVYGLEQTDGVQALVMELVEGPTLADRIAQGPIAVDEALAIARQITEALEAAHEQGIIHRDLKPANIKLQRDATVKVLDFGLAKALDPVAADMNVTDSPTVMSPAMTGVGTLLGTAAYMSPEQARGRAADRRADIWAFGCVLYEMLSGRRAFEGADVADTLANVLKLDPDWNRLPPTTSLRVRSALRACLQKDPKQRPGDAQTVRLVLDGTFDTGQLAIPFSADRPSAWRRAAPLAIASLVVAAFIGAAAWWARPSAVPPAVNRFEYLVPEGQQFRGGGRAVLALSDDGRQFVYNSASGLRIRNLGDLEARVIPGTEMLLTSPFFSPDGQSVGFFQSNELKRIPTSGGTSVVICAAENPFGVSWGADDTILFGQPNGIMRVAASGGTPQLVIPTKDGEQASSPQLLPDGDSVLFTITASTSQTRWDEAQIAVQSLRTGERKTILQGAADARYVSTGHIVYAVGDTLFAVAFDAERSAVQSGPVQLVQGISRPLNQSGSSATANYGISAGGTLVYLTGLRITGGGAVSTGLLWVNRDGREQPIPAPPRTYVYPRISPKGDKVALDVRDQQLDIWIWDLVRETLTRLTFDPGEDEFPLWSPDGNRVAFSSSRAGGSTFKTGLFWVAADGTGAVERLAVGARQTFPEAFTPDGSQVIVDGSGPEGNDDIGLVSLKAEAAEGTPERNVRPLLQTTFGERNATLSPDGRWLAYESDESGRAEIYVRPFPAVDSGRWQVSTGGGIQAAWARNGRELFYRSGPALLGVPVQTGTGFVAGTPKVLFQGQYFGGPGGRSYDVGPDGRFVFLKPVPDGGATQRPRITIVENWSEELRRLVSPR